MRRQKRFIILIGNITLILLFIASVIFITTRLFAKETKVAIISPLASSQDAQASSPARPDNNSLEKAVLGALAGTRGKYGIAIKNLKTREVYFSNEHREFDSTSLYKLWIMAVVFNQIQKVVLSEDQILSQDVEVLNKKFFIASESAELTEGKITSSVHTALEKMITISDNYSALLLTEKVRLSNVASFLQKNGLNGSRVGTHGEIPTSTASDITLFFEKLYKGELGDKNATEAMISLLKKQALNGKLPKYLPNNVVVAHKTGELGSFTHDAGIVYTQQGDYIITILSESNNPKGAVERIANVSREVYKHFTQRR